MNEVVCLFFGLHSMGFCSVNTSYLSIMLFNTMVSNLSFTCLSPLLDYEHLEDKYLCPLSTEDIFPQCDSFSFIFRYDYSLSILNRKLRPAADLAQRRLVMCVRVSVCLYVCISVCVQTSVSVCVYLCVCKHTSKVSHWKLHSNFLYNIKVVYIPMFS